MGIYKYTESPIPDVPPIPLLPDVTILKPEEEIGRVRYGKIDTGADVTIIPQNVVDELKLFPAGEVEIRGYEGNVSIKKTYWVTIIIEEYKVFVKVISSVRTHILIGRDILKELIVILNGKESIFEIKDP